MFPSKYVANPKQPLYLGVTRVFIRPAEIRLAQRRPGFLDFDAVRFAVHFGNATPVEEYFSAIFDVHWDELMQRVPELQRLRATAEVVGVFQWLAENDIDFDGRSLSAVPLQSVLTPESTPRRRQLSFSDVAPAPPLVEFAVDGPTRVIDEEGRVTTLRYERGRLARIDRFDGETLRVTYDQRGVPLLLHLKDNTAVFLYHPHEETVELCDNIAVKGEVVVSTPETLCHADADPNGMVDLLSMSLLPRSRS
jgi:hypothetical protein